MRSANTADPIKELKPIHTSPVHIQNMNPLFSIHLKRADVIDNSISQSNTRCKEELKQNKNK